jgi:hypothetical protein
MASSTPSDLWEVDKVEYMRYVDPNTGLVREGVNPTYKLADNVVRVKIAGEDHHITFDKNDERALRLAGAFKNLNADQIGPILGVLHGFNRYLSTISTSLNPEFVITNALRDIQTALINLTEQDAKLLKTKVIRDWAPAWRGIRRGENGKTGNWADEWLRFKRAGAKVGWIDNHKTPVDLEKALREGMGKTGAIHWTTSKVKLVGEWIEGENLAVENAIRLSTFVNLTHSGMNEERAASVAKNLTVNFNRKGDAGVFINSLYLFANASIQGSHRFFKFASSKKGMAVMGGIIAANIALDLLNRFIAGADDDDENRYNKITENEKQRNIIIMLPKDMRFKAPGTDQLIDYFKIPMPYGYNVPAYIGTTIGKYIDFGFGKVDDVSPGTDAGNIAGAIMGSFSPIGDATSIGQFVSPTIADPFIQLDENKSWNGGKIYPSNDFDESPAPDSAQSFASTPQGYKNFAQWLNHVTGGTEVTPGKIDVSPETMQHWVDFAGGGLARFVTSAIDAPIKYFTDKASLEAREIAFVRRVVGTIGPRENQELFYSHLREIQYAKDEIDAIYKMGMNTPEGQERMSFVAKKYPVAVAVAREMYPSFAQGRGNEDLDKAQIIKNLGQSISPDAPFVTPARPIKGETANLVTRLSRARKEINRLKLRDGLPADERAQLIKDQRDIIEKTVTTFNKKWKDTFDAMHGKRTSNITGQLGPLVNGKPRREQVAALRQSGYHATADLISSLPPTPDRRALEYFALDAARS